MRYELILKLDRKYESSYSNCQRCIKNIIQIKGTFSIVHFDLSRMNLKKEKTRGTSLGYSLFSLAQDVSTFYLVTTLNY